MNLQIHLVRHVCSNKRLKFEPMGLNGWRLANIDTKNSPVNFQILSLSDKMLYMAHQEVQLAVKINEN